MVLPVDDIHIAFPTDVIASTVESVRLGGTPREHASYPFPGRLHITVFRAFQSRSQRHERDDHTRGWIPPPERGRGCR